MVDFGIHLTSLPDQEAGQSPRELLDQHEEGRMSNDEDRTRRVAGAYTQG